MKKTEINSITSRRQFFNFSLATTAGLIATSSALARGLGEACKLTPPQTEGPFYPVAEQPDEDNDLTLVKGQTIAAQGHVTFILGTVTSANDCTPLANALVEIWQACATGKYNHPNDTNTAALDPHFQYWGKCVTNAQGHYWFKTILPGAYPADKDWMRPPHVHFKVHKLGFHELTTQMYFQGHPLNAQDKILKSLTAAEQREVVVQLRAPLKEMPINSKYGRFDLSLAHVR